MKSFVSISICLLVLCAATNASASGVVQGKCLEYNKETGVLRVEEYDTNFSADFKYGRSTGIETQFNTSKAQIGIVPEPDDIVRLAFDVVGDAKMALKIMNVSKQDLMKK
jgi:hypothetical protein